MAGRMVSEALIRNQARVDFIQSRDVEMNE